MQHVRCRYEPDLKADNDSNINFFECTTIATSSVKWHHIEPSQSEQQNVNDAKPHAPEFIYIHIHN